MEESTLALSRLSFTEVSSAICRRSREGSISPEKRDLVLKVLEEDLSSCHIVELTPAVSHMATELLRRHPLRAADALQLSSAMILQKQLGSTVHFAGFDERLNTAATAEGIPLADSSSPSPV